MTGQHPITPPPELWKQFAAGAYTWKEAVTYAYRAGADQELEACCEWLLEQGAWPEEVADLRATRRPKPLSLKEQALALVNGCNDPNTDHLDDAALDTIRRALEALPDD